MIPLKREGTITPGTIGTQRVTIPQNWMRGTGVETEEVDGGGSVQGWEVSGGAW